jgi:predicted N-acetyltransferase YhbS
VVRESSAADHRELAASLARAFDDDPVAQWLLPGAGYRQRALRRYFLEQLRQKQRYDSVWISSDLKGAAIWAPPGKGIMSLRDSLSLGARSFELRAAHRAPLGAIGMTLVERKHPHEPHFYLAALGVDPSAQGHGLGSELLRPILGLCDTDGVGAYLESSKPENIDFYARHGFRVTNDHKLPLGPTIHLMWREPQRLTTTG